MTPDILLTFVILIVAVAFFLSGRLRMDLVALLVMAALALTGLLTPAETLAGFGNPVVITVIAVFILSAGLARTGVAPAWASRCCAFSASGDAYSSNGR